MHQPVEAGSGGQSSPRGSDSRSSAVTKFLWQLGSSAQPGDEAQMAEIYASLRAMAARQLRSQRPSHTLQPTALVNEAFLRIFGRGPTAFADRQHFFKTAAAAMRTAIIDHERRRRVAAHCVPLDPEAPGVVADDALDMLAFEECLSRLEAIDPDLIPVVELRVFCSCSMEEAAAVLARSLRSVERDWSFARGWLRRELRRS